MQLVSLKLKMKVMNQKKFSQYFQLVKVFFKMSALQILSTLTISSLKTSLTRMNHVIVRTFQWAMTQYVRLQGQEQLNSECIMEQLELSQVLRHILKLKKSLTSHGALDASGYSNIVGYGKLKIAKGASLIMKVRRFEIYII